MEPEAIRLMRAIKERYPGVKSGDCVDPFIAATQFPDADLNPNDPMFRVALHELLEAEVLRHSTAPEQTQALNSARASRSSPGPYSREGGGG